MVKTRDGRYFLRRDGTPYLDKTTIQINKEVDFFQTKQIQEILKELNFPFIFEVYLQTIKEFLLEYREPYRTTKAILSHYLSIMNLPPWESLTYKDSDIFNRCYCDREEKNDIYYW